MVPRLRFRFPQPEGGLELEMVNERTFLLFDQSPCTFRLIRRGETPISCLAPLKAIVMTGTPCADLVELERRVDRRGDPQSKVMESMYAG